MTAEASVAAPVPHHVAPRGYAWAPLVKAILVSA